MFAPIASKNKKRSACRRLRDRSKIVPSHVTCWSSCDEVRSVAAIEADTLGARLMLPWNVQTGESIVVSLANEVGLYQTQTARVAWTERLELTGRVIAGVEFQEELKIAV
jgi:antitoxin component of MazEF toxin-antitoxin module